MRLLRGDGYSLVAVTLTLFFALVVALALFGLYSHERTNWRQRSQRASVPVRQWRSVRRVRPSEESVSVCSAAMEMNEAKSLRRQGSLPKPIKHSLSVGDEQTRYVSYIK